MSDVRTGARAPDRPGPAGKVAAEATDAASQAAGNVAGTVKEQAGQVVDELSTQARNVASDVRDKVTHQARTQNDKLANGIRRMSDDLDDMRAERGDSPAAQVVARVADGGRQVADYLADRGPEGVLSEVQDYARRKPGTFLAVALVAGFVVGRLGKGVMNADDPSGREVGKPREDAFVSDVPSPDSAVGTVYEASGAGAPVVVDETYAEVPVAVQPDVRAEGRRR